MNKFINKMPFANNIYSMYRKLFSITYFVKEYLAYIRDFRTFRNLLGRHDRFTLKWENRYPCLNDKTATTEYDRHYVLHTAWAAREVADIRPEYHVDISSSLSFCTQVSAFIPVKFYDYRPVDLHLPGLSCEVADLTALPFVDGAIKSLSCMHVVEHIGLGRYGEALDPDGDLKAIAELQRVLAPGGSLLFVVPIGGRPQIFFNAHRIYSYRQVIDCFAGYDLVEFSLVTDNPCDGGLMVNATQFLADDQVYGCGCFLFRKRT